MARDLPSAPHVRGRRISVGQVYSLVEERGEDSEAVADRGLLSDETMPAYRIASGLLSMVDAYSDRDVFGDYEELDAWIEE